MVRPKPLDYRQSHYYVLDLYAPKFLLIQGILRYVRLLVRRLAWKLDTA